MQSNENTLHSLTLEAQKRLSVTGVTDVDAFNETEIRAVGIFVAVGWDFRRKRRTVCARYAV